MILANVIERRQRGKHSLNPADDSVVESVPGQPAPPTSMCNAMMNKDRDAGSIPATSKIRFALVLLALSLGGCANVPAIIRAAAHDPAKVHLEIKTLYGDVVYDRDNSNAVALELAKHPVPVPK